VESYCLKINRAGFCSCPFHGSDRHPSMKIYKDSFYCFTCGKSGDVFTFVQQMDGCDFKTSFKALGGSYEDHNDLQRKLHQYKRQMALNKANLKAEKNRKLKLETLRDIDLQKEIISNNEVFSDAWCAAMNRFEYDFYILDYLLEGN